MVDSEGEFLRESFGDKEDLDRFKIPISGVSRGVDHLLFSVTVSKSGNVAGISHRKG